MSNEATLVVVTPELSPLQRQLLKDIEALCWRYMATIRAGYGERLEGPGARAAEAVSHTLLELKEMKNAGDLQEQGRWL